jgi:hypothetical protein
MTTPPELADDITNNLNRRNEADASLLTTSNRTIAALRTAADSLSALAMALDTEVMAHDRQTVILDADLANTANMVRDLEVIPPAPVAGTWFGYTRSAVGKAGLAKPGIVRDFTSGGAISVTTIQRTLGEGTALWYSWKPNLLTLDWLTSVETQLRQAVKPDGPPLFICVWHEPEGASDAGGGTVTAKSLRWRVAHSRLHDIVVRLRSQGYPIHVAPIICDWTFWDRSKGAADVHWYPKTWTDYDVQGYDVYPRGQTKAGAGMIARLTTTAPNVVAPYNHDIRTDTYDAVRLCSEWAAECGKPWGSGETGIIDGSVAGADVQYPYTRNQRAQRFIDIADDIANLPHPPLLWAWYNDGGCNVTNAPDTASVTFWNNSIAGNPTGWPEA